MREWLAEYRKKAEMSQEVLAEKACISQNFYSAIETGARNPSVDTAKKIADALGFDWTRFYEDQQGEKEG